MSRLTHCITAINGWSGPALTQYGQERVELGGPVVSRWLAKIANYLTNELAADLFGTGEATPTRIYTTLQPWQDTLWQIAARTMGWEVLDTRRPLPGDLFVTNTLGSDASDALDAGRTYWRTSPVPVVRMGRPAGRGSRRPRGNRHAAGCARRRHSPAAPPGPRRGTRWDPPVGAG